MQVIFYKTKDDTSVINKNLTDELTLTNCELKENTDIINPTIKVVTQTLDTLNSYNYCRIPSLGRYYFINDIIALKGNIYQLALNVDVLMTYKDEILDSTQNIIRQENKYNPNIVDSNILENVRVEREIVEFSETPINISNASASSNNYVLITAGGSSVVS